MLRLANYRELNEIIIIHIKETLLVHLKYTSNNIVKVFHVR